MLRVRRPAVNVVYMLVAAPVLDAAPSLDIVGLDPLTVERAAKHISISGVAGVSLRTDKGRELHMHGSLVFH